ncbi:unnamed protein product [Cylicocyclus nassatus]|uniref:Uncharacterized protein n=1 Tax=Cylicocyclus nassatus TaxID=53992 RepID=A0AA36M7S9_CYLNA|nr:unnamed protein product [Cylicocyclus nassatus]
MAAFLFIYSIWWSFYSMCIIIKYMYIVMEIIWPPRIPLRCEPYRVKNMLPSYGLIPDEVSDSEEDAPGLVDIGSSREKGGLTNESKESREMESTVRVHLTDDQGADGGTVENVSVLVKTRPRRKKVECTQVSEKRKQHKSSSPPSEQIVNSVEVDLGKVLITEDVALLQIHTVGSTLKFERIRQPRMNESRRFTEA